MGGAGPGGPGEAVLNRVSELGLAFLGIGPSISGVPLEALRLPSSFVTALGALAGAAGVVPTNFSKIALSFECLTCSQRIHPIASEQNAQIETRPLSLTFFGQKKDAKTQRCLRHFSFSRVLLLAKSLSNTASIRPPMAERQSLSTVTF